MYAKLTNDFFEFHKEDSQILKKQEGVMLMVYF